jgi:hypothetical protein
MCSRFLQSIYYKCIGQVIFYSVAIFHIIVAYITTKCCDCLRNEESVDIKLPIISEKIDEPAIEQDAKIAEDQVDDEGGFEEGQEEVKIDVMGGSFSAGPNSLWSCFASSDSLLPTYSGTDSPEDTPLIDAAKELEEV